MRSLIIQVLVIAALLAVIGCAEPATAPTTTATVATTASPASKATTTSTAAASPSPGVDGTPTPTQRPPVVTRLIDAVSADDAAALASLLQFVHTPCTTAQGAGGPPKCGNLPAGTAVEVMPISSCEFGWYAPAQARDIAASTLPSVGELQAVLRLTRPLFTDTDANYPALDHAVVFTRRASASPERAVVYGLNSSGVAYIELTCDSTAQQLLASPRYAGAEVLPVAP